MRALADLFDELGLAAYVQTTGSRGLHVVVPVKGDADFDTTRDFARDVASMVADDDPKHRTVEVHARNAQEVRSGVQGGCGPHRPGDG